MIRLALSAVPRNIAVLRCSAMLLLVIGFQISGLSQDAPSQDLFLSPGPFSQGLSPMGGDPVRPPASTAPRLFDARPELPGRQHSEQSAPRNFDIVVIDGDHTTDARSESRTQTTQESGSALPEERSQTGASARQESSRIDPTDTPPRSADRQQWLGMNTAQQRTLYIVLGAIGLLLLIPAITWIQKRTHTYVLPEAPTRTGPQRRVAFQPMRPKTLSRNFQAPPLATGERPVESSPGSGLRRAIPKTPLILASPGAPLESSLTQMSIAQRIDQLTKTASLLNGVAPGTRLRIIDAIEVCIDRIEADSRTPVETAVPHSNLF